MRSRSIEAFLRRSIAADAEMPDIAELQRLLDAMSTAEMQEYWAHFAADRAFSGASTRIPDWKTKEQTVRFGYELADWVFRPKERDAHGKYIIVRDDLEEHIRNNLLRHVQDERQLKRALRSRPLFDKLHVGVGLAVVLSAWAAIPIAISLLVLGGFLHANLLAAVTTPAVGAFMAMYGLYILMGIVRPLLRKFNQFKDRP
jgi:hypothetical protein